MFSFVLKRSLCVVVMETLNFSLFCLIILALYPVIIQYIRSAWDSNLWGLDSLE